MSNSPADFGDHPHDSDPDSPRPDPGLHHGGSPDRWRNVFDEAEVGLRRFLAAKLPQAADVDDCLQSVLVAMLKNKTEIPVSLRRAWLYRVAANEAAKWWRNKSTTERVLEKHAHSSYQIDTQSPHNIENRETLERVHQAIQALNDNAREIVRLRLLEGLKFQAIADLLQLPLGTVLTRMRRAMEQLRNELGTVEDDF